MESKTMPDRADAHIHLFHPGFTETLPATCRRITPDEPTLYEALAQQHNIRQALVVGYEAEDAYHGNNDYLATLVPTHPWVRPVAFYAGPAAITLESLESRRAQGFVGISLYLFDQAEAQLNSVPEQIWRWLSDRRWLLSINSTAEQWLAWRGILRRFPDLRLLISHLGLPKSPATPDQAAENLATVTALAEFPQVYTKLSGFYALSTPAHDYPHRAGWPLVPVLLEKFGPGRLLWGSDFTPALEFVSFPQTLDVLNQMPYLDDATRRQIEGQNLIQLLSEVSAQP
jgi:predicted TIM-barrel fold metal-dependent hydrolase